MQREVRYEDNGDWYSIGARKGTEKEIKTCEKGKGEKNKGTEKNRELKKLTIKLRGKITDQECPSKFKILYVKGRFHPHRRSFSKQEQAFRVQVPEIPLQTPESYIVEWQKIEYQEQTDNQGFTETSSKNENSYHQEEKGEKIQEQQNHKSLQCNNSHAENSQSSSFQLRKPENPSSHPTNAKITQHQSNNMTQKLQEEDKVNNKKEENKDEQSPARQTSPLRNKGELKGNLFRRKTKPIVDLVKKETKVEKEEDKNDKEKKESKIEKR